MGFAKSLVVNQQARLTESSTCMQGFAFSGRGGKTIDKLTVEHGGENTRSHSGLKIQE